MGTVLRGGTAITTGTASTTTLGFPVPAAVVSGDIIMIWCAAHAGAQTFSATSYTGATSVTVANVSAQLLYKTAVAADSGSTVTVTRTGSSNSWGGYLCGYGTQGFDPVPAVSGTASTNSTTVLAPGITTSHLGDTLVWLGMASATVAGATPGTLSVPAGYTLRGPQANSTAGTVGNIGVIWGDQAQSFPPGSTGNISGTDGNSNPNAAVLVGLQSFTAVTASTTFAVSGSVSGAIIRRPNTTLGGAASTLGLLQRTSNKSLSGTSSSAGKMNVVIEKTIIGQATALGFISTIYRQFRSVLLRVGSPLIRWITGATGNFSGNWDIGSPTQRWSVSTANISISQLSTEFVQIPVGVTINGVPYNPTADIVQFAFLLNPSAVPTSSNWVTGSWSTNSNSVYPYFAQALVGTAGSVALQSGTYTMWLRVTDSPEIPVHQVGMLTIY